MKFLDVFAGIGGFHIAAHSLGMECVGAVEFDKNSQKTYFDNFGIEPMGDITKMDLSLLPSHDILFGGFPCQPFSMNGKKSPSGDERAELYTYLIKILEIHKPEFFVFENVKGLLSKHSKEYLDLILSEIKRVGYTLTLMELNSSDYGLAQQRRRVYFVGSRDGKIIDIPEKSEYKPVVMDILAPWVDEKFFIKNLYKNRKVRNKGNPPTKYPTGMSIPDALMLDVIEVQKARKLMIASQLVGDTPSGLSSQRDRVYSPEGLSPTIVTTTPPAFLVDRKLKVLAALNGQTPSGMPGQTNIVYDLGGLSPTVTTAHSNAFLVDKEIRVLTPRECARLQGFPDSFKLPEKDSIAYKQLGNAVSVPVIVEILKNVIRRVNEKL